MFIGASFFFIGSLCAYIETVDAYSGEEGCNICAVDLKNHSWWAVFSFLMGTILYIFNTTFGLLGLNEFAAWVFAAIGGVFFVLGAVFEFIMNAGWKWRPYKLPWWISHLNLIGGILFAIAGFAGFVEESHVVGAGQPG